MHVSDEAQVLLVAAGVADGAPPFLDGLEDLHLHARGPYWRALGEAADELVEELLSADLQLEGIAAVLDADVEQVQGQQGDVGVAVVDVVDDADGGLARGRALLAVDQVGDLEVQRQVRLVILGTAGRLDKALKLGRHRRARLPNGPGRRTAQTPPP